MSGTSDVVDRDETIPGLVDLVPLAEPFHFRVVGLKSNGPKPTLEQCGAALQRLAQVRRAIDYNLGDLINLTEKLHGEESAQVIDSDLIDERVASELRFVTKNVDEDIRALSPGWEYSKVVAKLKPKDQAKWIQQALEQDWIASKMKTEIEKSQHGGSTAMRYLLIVDTKTEAKQNELAKKLEGDGFTVTKRTGVKRERKSAKKSPKAKKLTGGKSAKKTGAPRPYVRKRPKEPKK